MEVRKKEVTTVILTEEDVKEAVMQYINYRDNIKGPVHTVEFDCADGIIYSSTVVVTTIISESSD